MPKKNKNGIKMIYKKRFKKGDVLVSKEGKEYEVIDTDMYLVVYDNYTSICMSHEQLQKLKLKEL